MSGFQIPEGLEFVGWASCLRLMENSERHEFEERDRMLDAMSRLGDSLKRRVITEIVYVSRAKGKHYAYWFGGDCGKDYVYVLEFDQADWLSTLNT